MTHTIREHKPALFWMTGAIAPLIIVVLGIALFLFSFSSTKAVDPERNFLVDMSLKLAPGVDPSSLRVGQQVRVDVVLNINFNPVEYGLPEDFTLAINAIQAVLQWNQDELDFIRKDDTYASYRWMSSFFTRVPFLGDKDINKDLNDGDFMYTAFGRLVGVSASMIPECQEDPFGEACDAALEPFRRQQRENIAFVGTSDFIAVSFWFVPKKSGQITINFERKITTPYVYKQRRWWGVEKQDREYRWESLVSDAINPGLDIVGDLRGITFGPTGGRPMPPSRCETDADCAACDSCSAGTCQPIGEKIIHSVECDPSSPRWPEGCVDCVPSPDPNVCGISTICPNCSFENIPGAGIFSGVCVEGNSCLDPVGFCGPNEEVCECRKAASCGEVITCCEKAPPPSPPSPPELLPLVEFQEYCGFGPGQGRVGFRWEGAPAGTLFEFQIDDESEFDLPIQVNRVNTLNTQVVSVVRENPPPPGTIAYDTDYYWRVRKVGESAWSGYNESSDPICEGDCNPDGNNKDGRDGTFTTVSHAWPLPVFGFSPEDPDALESVLFVDETLFYDRAPRGVSGKTWIWDFGDGSRQTIRNRREDPTHTYTASGVYDISLEAIDADGYQCPSAQQSLRVGGLSPLELQWREIPPSSF